MELLLQRSRIWLTVIGVFSIFQTFSQTNGPCPGGGATPLALNATCVNQAFSVNWNGTGQTVNASCATGTFSDTISANSSVTCRLCPFGTYAQNDATTTCSECPAGKYGVVEGARSAGITFLLVTVSLMLSTWCNHESERT